MWSFPFFFPLLSIPVIAIAKKRGEHTDNIFSFVMAVREFVVVSPHVEAKTNKQTKNYLRKKKKHF